MYEMINEKLGIKACGLADLTADQVNHFLGLWEDGAKIGSLTVFFENDTGNLVLNKDNDMYDTYRELAEEYMEELPEARKELWESCPLRQMKETLEVMENCLKSRKTEKELFRARKNCITSKNSRIILNEIQRRYNLPSAVCIAFRYGMMQGKRIERAKKKKMA